MCTLLVLGRANGYAYSRSPGSGTASTQPPGWGNFNVEVVLRADPLTAVMLAVVTFISLLVAVYSIGYMHGDRGYWRFYSYIALFVFSMTMLVSVSNFVLLYVFWEAVGLCSYLLIGFWYEKPAAVAAGKKAFLVNRIGDFGFALGIFLIWSVYGTLDFHDTVVNGTVTNAGVLGQTRLAAPGIICRRFDWHGDMSAVIAGRLRQERAVPLARVVARRHGRPFARQRT